MRLHEPESLPSLRHNGSLDADEWRPSRDNVQNPYGVTPPEEGDLVGWRYGAWRVHEIRPYFDVDLTAEQRARLDAYVSRVPEPRRALAYVQARPVHVVLRHHSGPLVIKPGEEKGFSPLHDGTRQVSFTSWPREHSWAVLTDPYRTCSCHGHIWPCQDIDRTILARHQNRKMNRLIATTEPGVCAHCLEVITTRQKSLTFPEPSRFVPGAPGPTFHAGRAGCWRAAEDYERTGRLADNPDVARLASCPGIRFIHERHGMPADQRVECTAGPLCTGHHGPAGHRQDTPCWFRVDIAANAGAYARPSIDCGYRGAHGGCIGGDVTGGGTSLSQVAADLLWEGARRR